jgi:hypothetical protein
VVLDPVAHAASWTILKGEPPVIGPLTANPMVWKEEDAKTMWSLNSMTYCSPNGIRGCATDPKCLEGAFNLPPAFKYLEPFHTGWGVTDGKSPLQGYAACIEKYTDTKENVVVIGFRGTVVLSPMNWLLNADIAKVSPKRLEKLTAVDGNVKQVKFHRGVYKEYTKLMKKINDDGTNEVLEAMKQCSNDGKDNFHVRITGHSKGGGLAMIYLHGAMQPDTKKGVEKENNWGP